MYHQIDKSKCLKFIKSSPLPSACLRSMFTLRHETDSLHLSFK